MNYKLLFPTYRNRYLFAKQSLENYFKHQQAPLLLNLGTGEGDYDPMIAPFSIELIACDLNEEDIDFAKKINNGIKNITYKVENALDLSFSPDSFSGVVSIDVLEHVGKPLKMLKEIGRVLQPGGLAIITFPQAAFPWTYDPINRLLSLFTRKRIWQGAYAFGHRHLPSEEEFEKWASECSLIIIEKKRLSKALVALLEMYWTGWIQQVFKRNSSNANARKTSKLALRPGRKIPSLVKLTDALIRLDSFLFQNSKNSVGLGYVLKKEADAG